MTRITRTFRLAALVITLAFIAAWSVRPSATYIVASQPWVVVTTTATGTQNDFAPGLSGNTIVRCNNATLLTITGFAGGVDGQRVRLVSVGAGQVDVPHQNAGSAVANRAINSATTAATSLAAGVGSGEWVYDGTTARWRLVAHEQGDWIEYGTVTTRVGWSSTSIQSVRYFLRGRHLSVAFRIAGTSNSVASTFTTPYTSSNDGFTMFSASLAVTTDNGVSKTPPGVVYANANTTTIAAFSDSLGTAWTAANAKDIGGQIQVQVQ